jgi:cytochrome oxidase Cu insertion factor (SCO1/SenC/PrrC family)
MKEWNMANFSFYSCDNACQTILFKRLFLKKSNDSNLETKLHFMAKD